MVSPLDMIGRCEPVFAADQQESQHQDFDFTYPVEDFQIVNHAGVTIAMGDFYARVRAHYDDGMHWCEVIGWYTGEGLTTRIDGDAACRTTLPIVTQLTEYSILNMDKIKTHADELAIGD